MANLARLGINIDHVATLRQLRGTPYPSLLEAARMAERAGAHQITVHLREDRRHIQDEDVKLLRKHLTIPLNLEMAVTPEMVQFAKRIKPDWVCLVPEKRQEVTTEGGLALKKAVKKLSTSIPALQKSGIQVSLFVEPTVEAAVLSQELGADAVEFHTGRYCIATQSVPRSKQKKQIEKEFDRVRKALLKAHSLGLGCHAGHGLDYENVRPVAALELEDRSPLVTEYNIGHAIVCRAVLVGFERAVREMLSAIHAP